MSPEDLNVRVDFLGDVHHIEGNPLPLTVAIEPQNEQLASLGIIFDILGHCLLLLVRDFLKLDVEEFVVGGRLPRFTLGWELIILDVAQD